MASFAIVRHDGTVDIADGNSVGDIAARYGAPGNGEIVAYDQAIHGNIRHRFTSPENQREIFDADETSEATYIANNRVEKFGDTPAKFADAPVATAGERPFTSPRGVGYAAGPDPRDTEIERLRNELAARNANGEN